MDEVGGGAVSDWMGVRTWGGGVDWDIGFTGGTDVGGGGGWEWAGEWAGLIGLLWGDQMLL